MSGIRIEFSEDGRDFARRDWSALVSADPAGTIFHTPAFLKVYWEEFGEDPSSLLLAFGVEGDGAQVGAVALERQGEVLRFLGGTEVTDYLGPVADPGAAGSFATALIDALLQRDDWREADLHGLADDQVWLGSLRDAASERGLHVTVETDTNGVAPWLPLPGSWDAYLEGLPSKMRHEIRRKARRLEAEAGPVRLSHARADDILEHLDRFVELHRTSEGPKGVFMVPGMEIFFRRLGETFLPRGMFHLTFLELGGVKVAGTIGFTYEGTYSLYNSAFDHGWQHLSPGMVLVGEDVRIAIESGCSGFDMLRGDYAYKYRFGATPRTISRLRLRR